LNINKLFIDYRQVAYWQSITTSQEVDSLEEPAMIRTGALILALLMLAPAWSGQASDKAVLIEIGRGASFPASASAGGAVIVGNLTVGGFYWMPTTGAIFTGGVAATSVSRDGKVIVGEAIGGGSIQAAIWQRGTEWRLLGSFPNAVPCDAFLSHASGTSRDGSVVVGYARNGCTISHAFRWEQSTGMVDLGSSVPGQGSLAHAVSANGQVTVGYQEQLTGFAEGTKWVGTRQERVPGADGFVGNANAANADGSIIVGRICRPAASRPTDADFQSAWVWTRDGGTECLAAPRLRASPGPLIIVEGNATSDDGSVIGGSQAVASSPDSDAIIWIDRKPAYLKDFLRVNGVPDAFDTWINTGAIRGVSPDGRVLVGSGAAEDGFRGYIVVLGSSRVMP
jgi:probable HAF family extracellular repeat protein